MPIKRFLDRIPGGLMIVPLLLGAALNTLDQAHLPLLQSLLARLGAPAIQTADGETVYEFLRIGGFAEALLKNGALPLIGLFLVCVGAQMNFLLMGRSLKKGVAIASGKWLAGFAVGWAFATLSDPYSGVLGLSTLAIVAAMTNGNGGLYASLTAQYGNRSDVGALSVISLNDGPFLTMVGLGLLGASFPLMFFISVLVPLGIGFALGRADPEMRRFLAPGERLLIPFFAFALGANMNFGVFLNPGVVAGGLVLGVFTVLIGGAMCVAALGLARERSRLAGVAEASTAGNAVATPEVVALAAAAASARAQRELAAAGALSPEELAPLVATANDLARAAEQYAAISGTATAQISISVMTTALLCPLAVILYHQWEQKRGVSGADELEDASAEPQPAG